MKGTRDERTITGSYSTRRRIDSSRERRLRGERWLRGSTPADIEAVARGFHVNHISTQTPLFVYPVTGLMNSEIEPRHPSLARLEARRIELESNSRKFFRADKSEIDDSTRNLKREGMDPSFRILANLPLDIRTFIFTRYRVGRGGFPPFSDILSISRGIFKWLQAAATGCNSVF